MSAGSVAAAAEPAALGLTDESLIRQEVPPESQTAQGELTKVRNHERTDLLCHLRHDHACNAYFIKCFDSLFALDVMLHHCLVHTCSANSHLNVGM